MLLTDIWINFRELCLRNYELSPDNYISLPSLGFDAAIKMYTQKPGKYIELITDSDMYNLI